MENNRRAGRYRNDRLSTPDEQREAALEAFVARVAGELAGIDPGDIAARAGGAYDAGARELTVPVFGTPFTVRYPSLEAREPAGEHEKGLLWSRALLAHYFRTADGAPLAGRWVTLRDLPGALLYERTFQGYTGNELVRGFGPHFDRLPGLAVRYGAQPLSFGDVAFAVAALPRVPVAVVCYRGDDEMPAAAQLLFDAAVPHYLPSDALATVGARLTGLLLKAGGVARPRGAVTARDRWSSFSRP